MKVCQHCIDTADRNLCLVYSIIRLSEWIHTKHVSRDAEIIVNFKLRLKTFQLSEYYDPDQWSSQVAEDLTDICNYNNITEPHGWQCRYKEQIKMMVCASSFWIASYRVFLLGLFCCTLDRTFHFKMYP